MSQSRRIFTFVSRSAPYGCDRPRLCLDTALATAVFEQTVNYLFLDDGIYQLLKDQNADQIGSKTLGKALETLELYGIETVLVDSQSLEQRGMKEDDLLLAVQLVDAGQIRDLLRSSDYVFNL